MKLQASWPATLIKKIDPYTGVFLWISQMFENSFLYGTPPVAGSENGWKIS